MERASESWLRTSHATHTVSLSNQIFTHDLDRTTEAHSVQLGFICTACLTADVVPKQLYRNIHVDLDRSWASPESRVAMKNSLRWHEEGNQTQKGPRPLLDDSRLYVYKSLQYSCVERMFSTSRVLGWVDRRQSLRLQQHFYVKKMYLGEIKHCSYFKDYNRKNGRMF